MALAQQSGIAAPCRSRNAAFRYCSVHRAAPLVNRSRLTCQAQAQGSVLASEAFAPLLPLDDSYESAHSFSDFANWLVPGSLLVGRYPYVEPSRCKSYQEGEAKLEQILKAGITTFMSLQAEVPAQAELALRGVNGFMPYKSAAELIKHSMAGPPPSDIMNGLRTPELDRYLPPRHKPANEAYIAYAARETLEFAHSPIEDLSVPGERQLEEIVADMQRRIEAGEVLYAHCWGGRGRVGLVGACFLAATYGVSADEALERVQRAFDTRKDNERRSPETDEQHAMVRKFVAAHKSRQAGSLHPGHE
uniref:Tyrosine specific protein phosphatases domain-containing protein n=1 Tax=Tetradesmus obliquus TaxID=3088 RepID=A0A383V636_TETOB|eukprot:jgi/Sobl393_1/6975/SZX60242.1